MNQTALQWESHPILVADMYLLQKLCLRYNIQMDQVDQLPLGNPKEECNKSQLTLDQ